MVNTVLPTGKKKAFLCPVQSPLYIRKNKQEMQRHYYINNLFNLCIHQFR